MWKLLDPPYFITFVAETDKCYYIGVTDFCRYWVTQTSSKSFLADLKESNDGIEFDDEKELLQRGLDMVSNPNIVQKVKVTQGDNGALLSVSMSKMYEITLRLELGLIEASANQFFEMVVQPLLKTVYDLRASQQELRKLLIKKDKEIEEYKIEGKAPRRLITTVYDDAEHMSRHTTYEEHFNAPNVPEMLLRAAVCSTTTTTTTTTRKRPLSPQNTEQQHRTHNTEVKTQDTMIDEKVLSHAEKTETNSGFVEAKSRKQKKRLNY